MCTESAPTSPKLDPLDPLVPLVPLGPLVPLVRMIDLGIAEELPSLDHHLVSCVANVGTNVGTKFGIFLVKSRRAVPTTTTRQSTNLPIRYLITTATPLPPAQPTTRSRTTNHAHDHAHDHAQFERSVEQALQPTRDLLRNQHQLAKFNIGKASWKASWGFQAYERLRRTNSVNHEIVEKLHGIVKEAIA